MNGTVGLYYEPYAGTNIQQAAKDVIEMFRSNLNFDNHSIVLKFNDAAIVVRENTSEDMIVNRYHASSSAYVGSN